MAKPKKKKNKLPSPSHFRKPKKEEAEWPPKGVHSKSREGRKERHEEVLAKRKKMREAKVPQSKDE